MHPFFLCLPINNDGMRRKFGASLLVFFAMITGMSGTGQQSLPMDRIIKAVRQMSGHDQEFIPKNEDRYSLLMG